MAVFPLRYLRLRGKDNDDIVRRLSESGVIWYNTTKKTLNIMDGTTLGGYALAKEDLSNVSDATFLAKLTAVGGGAGSASITVSDSPPTEDLESGYIWLNTTNGKLYVYYYDGNSFQWIQPSQASWLTGPVGGGGGSGTVESSPLEGRLAYYALPGDTVSDLENITWLSDEFKITGKIQVTGQKNLIRFHWDSLADLEAEVNPVNWHGMIAHCHQEGRIYYAHSGQWIPVPIASDIPSPYTLPAASSSTRGGVIVPIAATSGLNNSSGTISLATASTTQKGGVIVDGTTITINGSGVISAVASSGSSISVSSVSPSAPDVGSGWLDSNTGNFLIYTGNQWVQPSSPTYSLPTASNSVLGGVKVDGTSITITNGMISVTNPIIGNVDNILTIDNEKTITNKTVNLSNNTLSGTLSQFNTALSDANFVSTTGTETLTNKTLTSPTLNTPTISTPTITNGTATGLALSNTSTISDGTTTYSIGYRNMPQSTNATGTLALGDVGKHIQTTGGITVPADASVDFPIGTVISIVSTSSSSITITQASGATLRLAGTTNTGNRNIAAYGMATLIKLAANSWYVAGPGVT